MRSISDPQAGYVIVPKEGINNYSEVQAYADSVLQEPYILKEKATVAVINASGKAATGIAVQTKLKELGYNVTSLTEATAVATQTTLTPNSSKPFTAYFLQKRFSATVLKTASTGSDLTLTIGSKYVIK